VADGLIARAGRAAGEEKPAGNGELGAAEPLAEWERELLEGKAAVEATEAADAKAAAEPADLAEPAQPADQTQEPASDEDTAPAVGDQA